MSGLKGLVRLFLFLQFWTCIHGLPFLKSLTISEVAQSDSLGPIVGLSTACIFLGGQACSNNQIPVDQLDGKFKLGSSQGLSVPILKPIFGSEMISALNGADISLAQPRVNIGKTLDILGAYKSQQGVRNAGFRGRGNYGASWGDQNSLLGDLFTYGKVNDVNFNTDRLKLDQQQKGGLQGLYEETVQTIVDPFNLNARRVKETCYARILFGGKGICSVIDIGLGPGLNSQSEQF